jgi:hypothetical protein
MAKNSRLKANLQLRSLCSQVFYVHAGVTVANISSVHGVRSLRIFPHSLHSCHVAASCIGAASKVVSVASTSSLASAAVGAGAIGFDPRRCARRVFLGRSPTRMSTAFDLFRFRRGEMLVSRSAIASSSVIVVVLVVGSLSPSCMAANRSAISNPNRPTRSGEGEEGVGGRERTSVILRKECRVTRDEDRALPLSVTARRWRVGKI